MPQPTAARPAAPVATAQGARPSAPAASAQMARASAPAAPKMPQSTAARTAAPVATRTAAPVSAVPQAPAPKRATSEAGVSRPGVQSAQRSALRAVSSEEAAAEPLWNRLFEAWGRLVVPRRFVVPLTVAAVAILVLSWVGLRASRPHRTPAPASVQAQQNAPSQTPSEAPTAAAYRPATSPVSAGVITRSTPVGGGASPSAIHEEIPDVPPRARHTIHGHIRVSVRVMVDQDGSVFAALVDQAGPSRYFRRLAIEAAKKWTFPPAAQPDAPQRLELVRFVFSRQGTAAHAIALK
jgi:TonB family protein